LNRRDEDRARLVEQFDRLVVDADAVFDGVDAVSERAVDPRSTLRVGSHRNSPPMRFFGERGDLLFGVMRLIWVVFL